MTYKWIQRLEERQAHLNLTKGTKRGMANSYLTDSDEKAIVDFVKDREELYNKTNEMFL